MRVLSVVYIFSTQFTGKLPTDNSSKATAAMLVITMLMGTDGKQRGTLLLAGP